MPALETVLAAAHPAEPALSALPASHAGEHPLPVPHLLHLKDGDEFVVPDAADAVHGGEQAGGGEGGGVLLLQAEGGQPGGHGELVQIVLAWD